MIKHPGQGFTLVETLIVLAVTGVLFASAVTLISGRQNTTQFQQAVSDLQTQMQQIIGEVATGYYNNDGKISCDAGILGPVLSIGAKDQGTNDKCVFLGKAVQFFDGSTNSPGSFNAYTIAALRGTVTAPADDLAAAKPRLVAVGTGDDSTVMPDVFEPKTLLYGLQANKMYYNGDISKQIGAVGFTSNPASLSDGDNSQQVNLLAIRNTSLSDDKLNGVKSINDQLRNLTVANGGVNPQKGVQICFESGGTTQSVLLTIGGAGRQSSIQTKIFATTTCS